MAVVKEHYRPGEIHFTKPTALWLIQNLGSLRQGTWPPEASSYIDIPGSHSGRHRAPFATPVEYAAEIESRLEHCGLDGLILEAIECWGKTDESLASYFSKPAWVIRKRAKRALRYVASGPDRRWHNTRKRRGETFKQFIGQEPKK